MTDAHPVKRKRGRPKKTQANAIRSTEWKARAVEMRLAGHTYAQIGAACGVVPQQAHQAVTRYLEDTRAVAREHAEDIRRLELDRLDRILAAIGPLAEGGDLAAVDRVLRIQERRASLLGLDAPKAQLVAVDARPDTVRALMALVAPAGSQANSTSVLDAARDVTPAHADSVRKPHA